jgi:hypothetical protein
MLSVTGTLSSYGYLVVLANVSVTGCVVIKRNHRIWYLKYFSSKQKPFCTALI